MRRRIFGFVCISLVLTGCTTVILDNQEVLKPESPDPLKFKNPICLHLDFKTDDIGFFNEEEGIKPMQELNLLKATSGLHYYNISIDCLNPIASYTVIFKSKTRNWWARAPWALLTFFSLGLIPFYVEDVGSIAVFDKEQPQAEINYREKRLTSVFAFPKFLADSNQTINQYHID